MTRVSVRGDAEAARAMRQLGRDANDLKPAFTKIAVTVARQAESKAAIRTGTLVNSITPSATGTSAHVVAQAGYSGYVNYGTRHMAGDQFLTGPANQLDPAPYIEHELDQAINKANNR